MWYEIITTSGTVMLVWWLLHRFSHPFVCTCGYRTWFAGSFRDHLLKGHKWHDK